MKDVLLVSDVAGWAWHRRCEGIATYAPADYRCRVSVENEAGRIFLQQFEAVLWSSWPTCPLLPHHGQWALVANAGCMYEEGDRSTLQARTASKRKNLRTARKRLPHFQGLVVINHRCLDFCRDLNRHAVYLRTGVDCGAFYSDRLAGSERPLFRLTVGWCGKPTVRDRFSPKGYHEVLLPLVEHLRKERNLSVAVAQDDGTRAKLTGVDKGGDILFRLNTRTSDRALATEAMRKWHEVNDVFLVTSCSEGTPSTALEAMACGRMVVGTTVGILPEVVTENHKAASLVPCYSQPTHTRSIVTALGDELVRLTKDLDEVRYRGAEAREVVQTKFNWSVLSKVWLEVLTNGRVITPGSGY